MKEYRICMPLSVEEVCENNQNGCVTGGFFTKVMNSLFASYS